VCWSAVENVEGLGKVKDDGSLGGIALFMQNMSAMFLVYVKH
jgi:hypothetical protein